MLKFSPANTKIKALAEVDALKPYLEGKRKVYSLDLLSGWSCPFADQCLSKVHTIALPDGKFKRKVVDGPNTEFRCFSASQEGLYKNVYNLRKSNYDQLKAANGINGKLELLEAALPKNAGVIRFHVGGDFFNQEYFDAAVKLAENHQDKLFYAYTKSLNYWLAYEWLPDNFVVTASRGGRLDNLIDKFDLRESIVVFSVDSAAELGLEIDHDDSHAADPSKRDQSFALLIHGQQPAGSEAAKAKSLLKGLGSYGKGTQQ